MVSELSFKFYKSSLLFNKVHTVDKITLVEDQRRAGKTENRALI